MEWDRRPIDPDRLTGFALGWSRELSLVQVIDRRLFRFDGFAVFRNADIRRWRPIPKTDFVARAAILNRLRPSPPKTVAIGSMKDAVSSAGSAFPLIAIHRERIKRGVCFVGKVLHTSQRALKIRYISPEAEWEEIACYSLRDVTLLEFGTAYDDLLTRMARAGNRPER